MHRIFKWNFKFDVGTFFIVTVHDAFQIHYSALTCNKFKRNVPPKLDFSFHCTVYHRNIVCALFCRPNHTVFSDNWIPNAHCCEGEQFIIFIVLNLMKCDSIVSISIFPLTFSQYRLMYIRVVYNVPNSIHKQFPVIWYYSISQVYVNAFA